MINYYNTEQFSFPKEDPIAIRKIIGFINKLKEEKLPFSTLDFVQELLQQIKELEPYFTQFDHLLLLGIGGSALGPHALQKTFSPQDKFVLQNNKQKQLWVIDNVHSVHLSEYLEHLPLEKTLVLTISKSGSTLETIAQYFICKQHYEKILPQTWQKHFFIITDKETGFLREEVQKYAFKSLPIPSALGGRFSIFCAVGLVPAAFLGIDYKSFIQGAITAKETFFQECENYCKSSQNPLPKLFELANFTFSTMQAGFSELIFFNYIPKWASLNLWFRQLWSESLGKQGVGSTPVIALGTVDQHSILQLFLDSKPNKSAIFLESYTQGRSPLCTISNTLPEKWKWLANKNITDVLYAETKATKKSMINHHIPLCSMEFSEINENSFGKLMWELCMVTILTAYFLEINPFDQPAVEESKTIAKQSLSKQN